MNHSRIYNQIIEKAKSRGLDRSQFDYCECHHIVPLCLGGADTLDNLVLLTAREHFIVHALLCYVYPHNLKIIAAFAMMNSVSKNHPNRYISSHQYKILRENTAKIISSRRTGVKDSEETRRKKSLAKLGNTATKGRKLTEEHKKKCGRSGPAHHMFGKKHSEETIRKITETNKLRWV